MGKQTDKAAARAAGSLLPSAEADGKRAPGGKASSSVDFSPFPYILFKGVKTHKGTGKAETIIYPSAEADGKRELAAQDLS